MLEFGPFCLDLGHFAWIWAIMLGFGPFCLDLGHIAWIWAIWQNLGQNRPQRRQSPEDGAGGDGRRNGQIPPVFYRTLSPSGPQPSLFETSLWLQNLAGQGHQRPSLATGYLLCPFLLFIVFSKYFKDPVGNKSMTLTGYPRFWLQLSLYTV